MGPNLTFLNFLTTTQQKALSALLRDARQNWTRVGTEPYAYGREGVVNFEGDWYEDGVIPGLISIPEWNRPNDPTPLLTYPGQPRLLRYRRRTWRGGVEYLWEAQRTDYLNMYKRLVQGLGEALEYSLERLYHEPFFRATDASYIGGWDAQPLGSANHQLIGSGTFNNLRTWAAPTDTMFQDIETYFMTVPDAYGRPVAVTDLLVFTSTKWELKIRQIFNSVTAITNPLSAGQVNPNPNIAPGFTSGRFKFVFSPYLNEVNGGNILFVLGRGHEMFYGKAFSMERMFQKNDPPSYQHEVWWSGNVGWRSAERILVYA